MKRILINLKDWFDLYENIDFAEQTEGLDITVFPSLPYLYIYKDYKIRIGSQKISSFEEGAHTGSISAKHLRDFGVEAVILNHKECQIDDSQKICSKIENAKKYNIEVILCLGSIGHEELTKIADVLSACGKEFISIAYEPLEELDQWRVKENLDYIKDQLRDYDVPYIYGGYLTSENILEYDKELDVDGYLFSSNVLNVDNLKDIITKLHN